MNMKASMSIMQLLNSGPREVASVLLSLDLPNIPMNKTAMV